jgi:hypothetical protein
MAKKEKVESIEIIESPEALQQEVSKVTELVDKNKKQTPQKFLDAANLDMETLKIKAIAKESNYHRYIATKADGFIYHMASTTMMGRNLTDVVEYLRNPLNEEILVDLTKKVEKHWNQ